MSSALNLVNCIEFFKERIFWLIRSTGEIEVCEFVKFCNPDLLTVKIEGREQTTELSKSNIIKMGFILNAEDLDIFCFFENSVVVNLANKQKVETGILISNSMSSNKVSHSTIRLEKPGGRSISRHVYEDDIVYPVVYGERNKPYCGNFQALCKVAYKEENYIINFCGYEYQGAIESFEISEQQIIFKTTFSNNQNDVDCFPLREDSLLEVWQEVSFSDLKKMSGMTIRSRSNHPNDYRDVQGRLISKKIDFDNYEFSVLPEDFKILDDEGSISYKSKIIYEGPNTTFYLLLFKN